VSILRRFGDAQRPDSDDPDGRRGQSLVEFALILPILLMLVGGIVQYGIIFATKHSLIQVGRDVGRWAATQGYSPCSGAATDPLGPQPVTQAHLIAQESRLMGYGGTAAVWTAANFTDYADNATLPSTPPWTQGVEVVWTNTGTDPCPPVDSTDASWVTIRLTHRAPVVLPGFAYLPGLGTCDSDGCFFVVSTTSEYRMEPQAGP
jgi:Flp pilus assembly protein TadG